jgi:Homeodomain-like domain
MSRRKKDPLRSLTEQELAFLQQLSRSQSAPAVQVVRAKLLLLVAQGQEFTAAARSVGRRSGDAVSALVARFNREGLAALEPRHAGGAKTVYDQAAKQRILQEFARVPDREQDGTASWSLTTLQTALRQAADGLPNVSTYTLWQVLREARQSPQRVRTWCETGTVLRKRKHGVVAVTDPDTQAKKS